MEKICFTTERNAQILLSVLKQNGISKVVASPGTTNIALVASMQNDSFFEMYSAPDERSAAYMACGLSAETGEPVVLTCTGATASRNYLPGLTEAFYRHLPILAVTSLHHFSSVGHLVAQVIDRTQIQKDVAKLSVEMRIVKDGDDEWDCTIKANKAIQALLTKGKGPVHINLETNDSKDFSVEYIPEARVIRFYCQNDVLPDLPKDGKIAVFIGAHSKWSPKDQQILDSFCRANNAVVFCDHTSNYKGEYRFLSALACSQAYLNTDLLKPDLVIHIGEVSGDYASTKILRSAKAVWRVSEDGQLRDLGHKLMAVFDMPESLFFDNYSSGAHALIARYLNECIALNRELHNNIPESLPFSNIWAASQLSMVIPNEASLHFGILNSLRSWNFFEIPETVQCSCNVGGFGIDGGLSTLVGASLSNPNKLFFGVFGDLAFFYDMNVLANRHVGDNIRILLVNNAGGTEFKLYSHPAHQFGDKANAYIAAAGHYGNKSPLLVQHYAEDLGFMYISASNKKEFLDGCSVFIDQNISKPVIFELFTDYSAESEALYVMRNLVKPQATTQFRRGVVNLVKSILKE